MRNDAWTQEMDDLLRELKTTDKYMQAAHQRGLPYKTPHAVNGRRWKLGILVRDRPKEWSEAEEDILRAAYPINGVHGAQAVLRWEGYTRALAGITARVYKLGLNKLNSRKRKAWSEGEVEALIELWPWHDMDEVMYMMRKRGYVRGRSSLRAKATYLGIEKGVDYYTS